ncbi:hypothetical protein KGP17_15425 [Serratia sp. JSRIV001]|uniref:hypothetical protein n=1 Tax=Serratia sp. JSRIV001 TaxID=2831893 RepID=UPI001CC01437|nr:hypothetical protein [Serratia sp. JSRIV001]UAN43875.1 hypothetical protein KGP17_15425 [Serratia sp. JSRIV001]
MDITLAFKKLSLTSGDEITLSIAHSTMQKMILRLIDAGYLTPEELADYIIAQLKNCDQQSLEHVLPESVMNKLTKSYESVKNGDNHV